MHGLLRLILLCLLPLCEFLTGLRFQPSAAFFASFGTRLTVIVSTAVMTLLGLRGRAESVLIRAESDLIHASAFLIHAESDLIRAESDLIHASAFLIRAESDLIHAGSAQVVRFATKTARRARQVRYEEVPVEETAAGCSVSCVPSCSTQVVCAQGVRALARVR